MTTTRASLGRGKPPVYLNKAPTVPLGLILKLPGELEPRSFTDSSCTVLGFDHVPDAAELVHKVGASVGNAILTIIDKEGGALLPTAKAEGILRRL